MLHLWCSNSSKVHFENWTSSRKSMTLLLVKNRTWCRFGLQECSISLPVRRYWWKSIFWSGGSCIFKPFKIVLTLLVLHFWDANSVWCNTTTSHPWTDNDTALVKWHVSKVLLIRDSFNGLEILIDFFGKYCFFEAGYGYILIATVQKKCYEQEFMG